MAKKGKLQRVPTEPKKTTIGRGPNRKWGNKGGGVGGSTLSKGYKKKYKGQG